MAKFKELWDLGNLRRAYRWILSNPEGGYKAYSRPAYSDYALSSELNLRFLSRQIRYGRFQPTSAAKVFTPKASGLLRPFTLLTVNDQIAYQAAVNLVAEAVSRRTARRHRKIVFHHLYAGKSSQFFYLKWQDNYRAFSRAVRTNFASGYRYIATFDLTAFYDTIDHHVLSTMLKTVRLDHECTQFLINCLREWTSSTWSDGRASHLSRPWNTPRPAFIRNVVGSRSHASRQFGGAARARGQVSAVRRRYSLDGEDRGSLAPQVGSSGFGR